MRSYIVMAGNIGAGKSTLVGLLADRLGWKPSYEPVAENPYLADFYADMGRWAFQAQAFFLMHRARSHMELARAGQPAVQDRSIYEDAEVFAENLARQGFLAGRDYDTYRGLYSTLVDLLPPPDLVVYLRASLPTLKARIAARGRDFERAIPDAYLEGLNRLYDDWIARFGLCPVLVVDADSTDVLGRPSDLDGIVLRVEEALRGKQGALF